MTVTKKKFFFFESLYDYLKVNCLRISKIAKNLHDPAVSDRVQACSSLVWGEFSLKGYQKKHETAFQQFESFLLYNMCNLLVGFGLLKEKPTRIKLWCSKMRFF